LQSATGVPTPHSRPIVQTAPFSHDEEQMVRVTHPFHPLSGQEFIFIRCRKGWREKRVWFQREDGTIDSIPLKWCNLRPPDPYLDIEEEHAPFRIEDLLELSYLIEEMRR